MKKDMTFAGVKFDEIDRNLKIRLKKLNLEGEFDVILQNGDTLALIEVKLTIRERDITKLIEKKISDFRILFPYLSHYKILVGLGGMNFEGNAEDMAKNNGVGIIKVAGDKIECYTDTIKYF